MLTRPKQGVNIIVQSQIGLLSVPDDTCLLLLLVVCLHLFFNFEFVVFHDIGIGSNSFPLLDSKGAYLDSENVSRASVDPVVSSQWVTIQFEVNYPFKSS